ncbi:MAG: hypothetical protein ACK40G_09560 [Cytophagaceae bacterium]
MKRHFFVFVLFCLISFFANGQYKVREQDILFKKHIVRSVPLNHPENIKLFGNGNTVMLPQILLEAFYAGKITGYQNEMFDMRLTPSTVKMRMQSDGFEGVKIEIMPEELTLMEVGEDFIFDKHHSEMIIMPVSITLMLPAKNSPRGLLEPIVSFSYDECLKIFQADQRAKGENPYKLYATMGYKEIFLSRPYKHEIVKMGPPDAPYFDQIYQSKTDAYIARRKEEEKLKEMLYKLGAL